MKQTKGKSATKSTSAPSMQMSMRHWLAWMLPLLSLLSVSSLNDPATLPRQILWCLALLSWMGMIRFTRRKEPAENHRLPTPLMVAIGLTLAAHFISFIAAINAFESLLSTLRMAMFFLSFWMVFEHQKGGGHSSQKAWLTSIWVTGCLQAMVVCVQWLLGGDSAPMGTQQNANLVGTLVALSLPATAWLALRGAKSLRISAIVSMPLMVASVYLSESRAGLLMLLVFALLGTGILLASLKRIFEKPMMRTAAVAIALLALAAGSVMLYVGWGRKEMPRSYSYLTDNTSVIKPETSSIEVRMILWNKSIQMMQRHPITGVGAGNWKLEIPSYGIKGYNAKGTYGSIFYVRPHNDFLWVLSETGILGFVGYAGFFIVLIGYALGRRKEEGRSLRVVALLGIVGYMVDAFFSFPIERMENTVMLAVYASLALHGHEVRNGKKSIALSIALLVLIPSLLLALLRLPSDAATFEMRKAQEKRNYRKMQEYAEQADRPWCRYEAQTATPFGWHLAMSKVEQARSQGAASMAASPLLREAIDDLQVAKELAPYNYLVLSELGSTYSAMGQVGDAISAYQELLAIYPDNDQGWVNLAVCLYNAQRTDEIAAALDHVTPGFEDPNFAALRQAFPGKPTGE